MCGRIVQKTNPDDYLERLIGAPKSGDLFPPDLVGPRYNIPPGTRPLSIHHFDTPVPTIERVYWGYLPENWKRAPISNAKIETVAAGRWPWQWLVKDSGRTLVPADGWYEWKWLTDDPKGPKQPYYIHQLDQAPLYFAALCAWRPGDSHGGMVDVHDRRPVALPATLAIEWLDPSTTQARAAEIMNAGLPEDAFRWHTVRQEVGNSRYQLPDAIDPA
jgi:putative SOS response-associated peptidase YedK